MSAMEVDSNHNHNVDEDHGPRLCAAGKFARDALCPILLSIKQMEQLLKSLRKSMESGSDNMNIQLYQYLGKFMQDMSSNIGELHTGFEKAVSSINAYCLDFGKTALTTINPSESNEMFDRCKSRASDLKEIVNKQENPAIVAEDNRKFRENDGFTAEKFVKMVKKHKDLEASREGQSVIPFGKGRKRYSKQCDVIEKRKVHHHRVDHLVGQFGVYAKEDIKQYTLLGKYTGNAYLANDYEKMDESAYKHDVGRYSFDSEVLVRGSLLSTEQKTEYKMDLERDNNEDVYLAEILISAKDNESILMFVNDCRSDITKSEQEDDAQFNNVAFFTVYCDGWPELYGIASRNIKKGEELATNYGDNYCTIMKESEKLRRHQAMLDEVFQPFKL